MNESEMEAEHNFIYVGFIPLLPNIMSPVELNTTNEHSCICGDIQEEDYSPLYAWFNYILIICLLPWLSIFGLATNVCNVFIFSRKRMVTAANTYLFFLACSDFLVILTGVFIFWVDSARSYIRELQGAPYTSVYVLPLGYMAQTCSIYIVVAAAVDCYISVCWKSQARSYCTVKRARQIIVTITVISILYNSLRFPQFNLRKCLPDGGQEFVIEICPTVLFFAINTVYNVYMYLVFLTLIPFFFLLILNVLIVAKQQTAIELISSSRKTSLNNGETGPNNYKSIELKKEHVVELARKASSASSATDDTITMIMVVVLFLCCNTLALVVNLIETFGSPDPILLNLLSDASNFLVVLNSSVNCIIYFIFNKEYRDLFLHYYLMVKERYCSRQKSLRRRPTEIYQNGSTTSRDGSRFLYRKADFSGVSRKADVSSRLDSPVWQPINTLPNSNTTTTKLSPPEEETPNSNGINVSNFNDVSPQTPSSPFMPSIYSELKLVDADANLEDETVISTTHTIPVFAPYNNGFQPPYSYMAELKLSDVDQANSKPQTTVYKPVSSSGAAHNNTGSSL